MKIPMNADEWRDAYEGHLRDVTKASDQFPWHSPQAYACWLIQTFHLVKYTTRFIALTSGFMAFEHNKLHYDLMSHFREEKGHDQLALEDLRTIGFDLSHCRELPETKAIVRSQYYALLREDPFAHFGYSFCFEGYAVKRAGAIAEVVQNAFGPGCAKFLQVHAEVDQRHFDQAFEVLKDVNEEQAVQILSNLEISCSLYVTMLGKLAAKARGNQGPKAA